MAALTFYSNFYSDPSFSNPQFYPDLFHLPPPHFVPDPVFDYGPASVDDSVIFPTAAPFFDDDASSLFFTDIGPYFSAPVVDELLPVSAGFFPCDEFELHCYDRLMLEQSFCYGGGGNVGYFPPPPPPPTELFSSPWDRGMDNAEIINNNGGCLPSPSPSPNSNLSAQTIAARERRRKITAKTQELGELVPGGSKMNTAEMLNSAFKYVKFLQAQVDILQLKQETEQEEGTENLQILESTMVQEKLYSEEQCLVPKGFVQNLTNFSEIQSQPSILNSINQILQTSSTEQMQN